MVLCVPDTSCFFEMCDGFYVFRQLFEIDLMLSVCSGHFMIFRLKMSWFCVFRTLLFFLLKFAMVSVCSGHFLNKIDGFCVFRTLPGFSFENLNGFLAFLTSFEN